MVLALLIQDMDSSARSFILEISMEYGDSLVFTLEATVFSKQPPTSPDRGLIADHFGHQLHADDHLLLEIGYYL
ncbi:MAG TPA: hypothetical protein DCF62_04380 [Porticoccaceae bacterium]|nr:hypothetical protein [Porticoccaceae bacterium]